MNYNFSDNNYEKDFALEMFCDANFGSDTA